MKLVVQYYDDFLCLKQVVGILLVMVFGFFILLVLVFLLVVVLISQGLFGYMYYQGLVCLVVLVQMGIVWVNFLLVLMKGFCDVVGNVFLLIVGSLIGVVVYYVCYVLGGYQGVLLGLVLVLVLVVVLVGIMFWWWGNILLSVLCLCWDNGLVGQLLKFILMVLIILVILLVVYVMMCNLLVVYYGWEVVGIWQGVSSIFDVYLQFIIVLFSVYLLLMLLWLSVKMDIICEIVKLLKFVLLVVVVVSLMVWLLCDFVIWLLFFDCFIVMCDLFVWQLVGDVLKVGVYVYGYLVIVKVLLCFYILMEISQFVLLIVFLYWFILVYGVVGVVQVYMVIYIVYFVFCSGVFLFWCKWV